MNGFFSFQYQRMHASAHSFVVLRTGSEQCRRMDLRSKEFVLRLGSGRRALHWEKLTVIEVEGKLGFWVYILKCADNSYYIGHTDDLEKRMGEHQTGEVEGYTSTRLPVVLVFAQDFPSREEALLSERRIKGWSRKKKEALIKGDWAEVSRLARKKQNVVV